RVARATGGSSWWFGSWRSNSWNNSRRSRVGELIRNLRQEHHLSQEQPAKRLNTAKSAISWLENHACRHVVNHGIAERRTASKYLKQLEEIGILGSYKAWKETIYINRPLMELLNKAELFSIKCARKRATRAGCRQAAGGCPNSLSERKPPVPAAEAKLHRCKPAG
ncbi:MAG: XRE family transcriptional regulator, partial [Spirochaetaceae bacterium]